MNNSKFWLSHNKYYSNLEGIINASPYFGPLTRPISRSINIQVAFGAKTLSHFLLPSLALNFTIPSRHLLLPWLPNPLRIHTTYVQRKTFNNYLNVLSCLTNHKASQPSRIIKATFASDLHSFDQLRFMTLSTPGLNMLIYCMREDGLLGRRLII